MGWQDIALEATRSRGKMVKAEGDTKNIFAQASEALDKYLEVRTKQQANKTAQANEYRAIQTGNYHAEQTKRTALANEIDRAMIPYKVGKAKMDMLTSNEAAIVGKIKREDAEKEREYKAILEQQAVKQVVYLAQVHQDHLRNGRITEAFKTLEKIEALRKYAIDTENLTLAAALNAPDVTTYMDKVTDTTAQAIQLQFSDDKTVSNNFGKTIARLAKPGQVVTTPDEFNQFKTYWNRIADPETADTMAMRVGLNPRAMRMSNDYETYIGKKGIITSLVQGQEMRRAAAAQNYTNMSKNEKGTLEGKYTLYNATTPTTVDDTLVNKVYKYTKDYGLSHQVVIPAMTAARQQVSALITSGSLSQEAAATMNEQAERYFMGYAQTEAGIKMEPDAAMAYSKSKTFMAFADAAKAINEYELTRGSLSVMDKLKVFEGQIKKYTNQDVLLTDGINASEASMLGDELAGVINNAYGFRALPYTDAEKREAAEGGFYLFEQSPTSVLQGIVRSAMAIRTTAKELAAQYADDNKAKAIFSDIDLTPEQIKDRDEAVRDIEEGKRLGKTWLSKSWDWIFSGPSQIPDDAKEAVQATGFYDDKLDMKASLEFLAQADATDIAASDVYESVHAVIRRAVKGKLQSISKYAMTHLDEEIPGANGMTGQELIDSPFYKAAHISVGDWFAEGGSKKFQTYFTYGLGPLTSDTQQKDANLLATMKDFTFGEIDLAASREATVRQLETELRDYKTQTGGMDVSSIVFDTPMPPPLLAELRASGVLAGQTKLGESTLDLTGVFAQTIAEFNRRSNGKFSELPTAAQNAMLNQASGGAIKTAADSPGTSGSTNTITIKSGDFQSP